MASILSLDGSDWVFKDFYGEDWLWRGSYKPDTPDKRQWRTGGSVPGSVQHDVWQQGEVPGPYYGLNSRQIEWVSERTWLYRKSFRVSEEHRDQRARLYFAGVDYSARFFFNGEMLGEHQGMYTPAVFEVGDRIRWGEENLVAVVIDAAPPGNSRRWDTPAGYGR